MTNCITRRHLLGGLLAAPAMASPALAQTPWPSTTIKIIVPAPPAGGVDVFVRGIGEQLAATLKQAVVIENKAGAGGLLGVKAAAQSAPDGYTLTYIHSGLVTIQAMNPKLDLLKELRPIAKLSHSPFMVVVGAESRYKTFQDLVADVQARPDKLTFGSGGPGSPAHLAVEYLEDRLGNFKAVHVPFKGAIEGANAIVGGQVDFMVGLLGAFTGLVQGGRLRALAVTSRNRVPLFPNVPTLSEVGVPGFVFEPWGGLAAPAGTPDAVVARLNEVLPGILNSAASRDMFAKQAGVADYAPPGPFAAQIAREVEIDKVIVKKLGMTPQS